MNSKGRNLASDKNSEIAKRIKYSKPLIRAEEDITMFMPTDASGIIIEEEKPMEDNKPVEEMSVAEALDILYPPTEEPVIQEDTHIGSSFDSFLKEECIKEEVDKAIKEKPKAKRKGRPKKK